MDYGLLWTHRLSPPHFGHRRPHFWTTVGVIFKIEQAFSIWYNKFGLEMWTLTHFCLKLPTLSSPFLCLNLFVFSVLLFLDEQIGTWYSNNTLAMNSTSLDLNASETLANKTLIVTTILVKICHVYIIKHEMPLAGVPPLNQLL